MLPFKKLTHFTEQKAKKKESGMSGHINKFYRGFFFEEANQHLHQLFWCLPLVVLIIQDGGGGVIKLEFHFKAQIHKSNICPFGENWISFQTNVFLFVIFTNKTGYPKGAVQQMEVEIATLYNTMHVNLYDRPEFGSAAMDLNMATGSLCTVVLLPSLQNVHLF